MRERLRRSVAIEREGGGGQGRERELWVRSEADVRGCIGAGALRVDL